MKNGCQASGMPLPMKKRNAVNMREMEPAVSTSRPPSVPYTSPVLSAKIEVPMPVSKAPNPNRGKSGAMGAKAMRRLPSTPRQLTATTRGRCDMSGVTLRQKAAARSNVHMMAGVEHRYIKPT